MRIRRRSSPIILFFSVVVGLRKRGDLTTSAPASRVTSKRCGDYSILSLTSDVYRPAQLCRVRPRNLEPTAYSCSSITRTYAVCILAPAQDRPVPALDRCWLQSWPWVSCTVVRRRCDCTEPVWRRLRMSRLDATQLDTGVDGDAEVRSIVAAACAGDVANVVGGAGDDAICTRYCKPVVLRPQQQQQPPPPRRRISVTRRHPSRSKFSPRARRSHLVYLAGTFTFDHFLSTRHLRPSFNPRSFYLPVIFIRLTASVKSGSNKHKFRRNILVHCFRPKTSTLSVKNQPIWMIFVMQNSKEISCKRFCFYSSRLEKCYHCNCEMQISCS